MINYTNISEAWGLNDDIKEKKEMFKNSQQNLKKNIIKNDNCDLFDELIKCDKFNKKLETFFNNRNKIHNKEINDMTKKIDNLKEEIEILKKQVNTNTENNMIGKENMENSKKPTFFENLIENFEVKIKPNKHLFIYLVIFSMFIISILLIHSFRKPMEFNTPNKKFFIFPEDIDKLKNLIDIAKN